jgi:hypothetical protein
MPISSKGILAIGDVRKVRCVLSSEAFDKQNPVTRTLYGLRHELSREYGSSYLLLLQDRGLSVRSLSKLQGSTRSTVHSIERLCEETFVVHGVAAQV